MRGRQVSLSPAAIEATAFFGHLSRNRYGMKMEGQEKDRHKQQQSDEPAPPVGLVSRSKDSH